MIPGAYEVAAGVHRIPLPLPNDGLRAVNVYAITGGDELVVVDAGWAITEGRAALADGLRILGLGLSDVDRFLVTHIHRDHYTQAVALRADYGMKISLGEDERGNLDSAMHGRPHEMEPQLGQMRLLGAAELAAELEQYDERPPGDIWGLPDDWLVGNQTVAANDRSLSVIPTPGHTYGHVVFHDAADRLLFAGDHVLPTITPSIGFEAVLVADPLGNYLRSLAIVRALPDAMLLPAHGAVGPSVHARVDELLEHHDGRLRATAKAVVAGASTAYEVAQQLRWTSHGRAFAELNVFNRMLAVSETSAHLELLAIRGELRLTVEDGVQHYSA